MTRRNLFSCFVGGTVSGNAAISQFVIDEKRKYEEMITDLRSSMIGILSETNKYPSVINDEETRGLFRVRMNKKIDEYRGKNKFGIYLKCDEYNNNNEVIDRNQFIANLYIWNLNDAKLLKEYRLTYLSIGQSFEEIVAIER